MPKLNLHRRDYMTSLVGNLSSEALQQRLGPDHSAPQQKQPRSPYLTPKAVEKRWEVLGDEGAKAQLLDSLTREQMDDYKKNIENFIGTVKLPVGIAGPLRVNGLFAEGDYHVPLATTEAALVASYNRGSQLITKAGGASVMLLNEGVTRTPCFAFFDLIQAGQFVAWVVTQYDKFRDIAESTTRHGKLTDISVNIEGNHVYLVFEYLTGDASGQNMVTISTNAVFEYILHHSPIKPEQAFLDGNLSGDKKATAQTLRSVRGKKVTARSPYRQGAGREVPAHHPTADGRLYPNDNRRRDPERQYRYQCPLCQCPGCLLYRLRPGRSLCSRIGGRGNTHRTRQAATCMRR